MSSSASSSSSAPPPHPPDPLSAAHELEARATELIAVGGVEFHVSNDSIPPVEKYTVTARVGPGEAYKWWFTIVRGASGLMVNKMRLGHVSGRGDMIELSNAEGLGYSPATYARELIEIVERSNSNSGWPTGPAAAAAAAGKKT